MRNKRAYCGISIFILLVLTTVCTSGVCAKETSVVAFDVNQTNIEEITQKIVSQGPRPTSFPRSTSEEEMKKGKQATQQAVEYIKYMMIEYGLETSSEKIREKPFDIYNVVGIKHGTNLNDLIIIVCAHYDTVAWSPGADDDALGVAATLEIARLLQDRELNRTVYFLSLPEHSFPIGAERWIVMHPELRDNVIGVILLDQIGYGDKLRIIYTPQNEWLADLVQRSGNDSRISIEKDMGADGYSDHVPFMQINIPAVQFIELNFTPYHHKSGDTIETLNFSLAEDATKTAVESIYRLATPKDTDPPVVNILRPRNTVIQCGNTFPLTYNISEDDTYMQVFLDGANLGDIKSGHWLVWTQGPHDLEVWATDECGNTGRATASFEVDVSILNALKPDTTSNRSLNVLVIGLFVVLLMLIIIIRYKRNNRGL